MASFISIKVDGLEDIQALFKAATRKGRSSAKRKALTAATARRRGRPQSRAAGNNVVQVAYWPPEKANGCRAAHKEGSGTRRLFQGRLLRAIHRPGNKVH